MLTNISLPETTNIEKYIYLASIRKDFAVAPRTLNGLLRLNSFNILVNIMHKSIDE